MTNKYVTFDGPEGEFGGFSSKALQYPMLVNGIRIPTVEHLFQVFKFPDHPEIQEKILKQATPVLAKRVSGGEAVKPLVRKDWDSIQVEVMNICLRVKLLWNWVSFGRLIESSEGKDIYDLSNKFWGVIKRGDEFEGQNELGKLLMELRDQYVCADNHQLHSIEIPGELGLRIFNKEITPINRSNHLLKRGTRSTEYVNQFRF